MNDPETPTPDGTSQLYVELCRTIQRYGRESDVTVYQMIGILERIKLDFLNEMDRQQNGK